MQQYDREELINKLVAQINDWDLELVLEYTSDYMRAELEQLSDEDLEIAYNEYLENKE